MNITHYVSDLVSRIKNASLAKRRETLIPLSKMNRKILELLVKEGYIDEVKSEGKENKSLLVRIKYEKRLPIINGINVLSKPSLRLHKNVKEISDLARRGKHTIVVSTSQGIMTGSDTRKKKIGGEVLFEIW